MLKFTPMHKSNHAVCTPKNNTMLYVNYISIKQG